MDITSHGNSRCIYETRTPIRIERGIVRERVHTSIPDFLTVLSIEKKKIIIRMRIGYDEKTFVSRYITFICFPHGIND